MSLPGAKISTQLPKFEPTLFERDQRWSFRLVAPTTIRLSLNLPEQMNDFASAEDVSLFLFVFPALATTTILLAMALLIAVMKVGPGSSSGGPAPSQAMSMTVGLGLICTLTTSRTLWIPLATFDTSPNGR